MNVAGGMNKDDVGTFTRASRLLRKTSLLLNGVRYKPDSMSWLERCSILYDRKTELLNIYVRIDTYANRMKWLAASEAYDNSGCE